MTATAVSTLRASLEPGELTLDLEPAPMAYLEPVGHRSAPCRRSFVGLESPEPRRVRLRVTGLRSGWVRWSPLARRSRELEGGVALDEQDQVSEDGATLAALLRADERREFPLEFSPFLADGIEAGVFPYEVHVLDDATGKPLQTLYGSLHLAHPASRFLNLLPALYGEAMRRLEVEEETTPFFTRYLLGFEDGWKPLQRTLDRMDALFGPFSTPPEFLLWLGSWVCLPPDEGWSEMKRRRLVHEAVELFRWRGTRRGLSRYLEIYTGYVPEIDDQPVRGMRLGSETKMGGPGTTLGDIPPHTFVVTVAVPDPRAVDEGILHEIIAYEKPAHAAYSLRVVQRSAA